MQIYYYLRESLLEELIHIDELIKVCGHFTWDTELNGGYGCNHTSPSKQEVGKCYAFDCPIAYMADLEDFKKLHLELYQEYLEYAKAGLENHDWLVCAKILTCESTV